MSHPCDAMAQLAVSLPDFIAELRRLWRVLGRGRCAQTVLGYSEGRLWLRCGGAGFTLEAQGHWPGEARVASSMLKGLSRLPPMQSPLILRVAEGRLHVASVSFSCVWQAAGSAVAELPMGTDMAGLLRLDERHDDAVLACSGIFDEVNAARTRFERKLATAQRALAALGIAEQEVEGWVRERMGLDSLAQSQSSSRLA